MQVNYRQIMAQQFQLLNTKFGSAIKGESLVCMSWEAMTSTALTSQQVRYIAVPVYTPGIITGVKFMQVVQGSFTAANENAIALFSASGGTLTQRAKTANDGNIWKGAATSIQTVNFASTYTVTEPDIFIVELLYCNSAQTTAPTIGAATASSAVIDLGFSNSMCLSGTRVSQTAITTPHASTVITTSATRPWILLF